MVAEQVQMMHTTAAAKILMSNITVIPAVITRMHVAHMCQQSKWHTLQAHIVHAPLTARV